MTPGDPPHSIEQLPGDCEPVRSRTRRWDTWLSLVIVYIVVLGLFEARLSRPGIVFGASNNVQIGEAAVWWQGRLDLPERQWDTALSKGRVYSHFPVMFSAIAGTMVPLFQGVPHWFIVLLVVIPVPLLAHALFSRLTGSPWSGAILSVGLICGTSAWPIIKRTVGGCSPYFVNHTLATIGLLILLNELFGRRRVWVAGLGLLVATLSRQLTVAYAIPLTWLAVWGGPTGHRGRRILELAAVGVVVAAVPLTANWLKFGHPLQAGYMLIYEGRNDGYARDARTHGVFAANFVPRNLYYMNLGFPRVHRIEVGGESEVHLRPNTKGTGIWWTTPLLLWLLIDIRRVWRDPAARGLLISAALVCAALMCFHATGSEQRGYNRFSMDFMPALLAIIAPTCVVGKRRWISLLMVVWSVVYFRWLI